MANQWPRNAPSWELLAKTRSQTVAFPDTEIVAC
jgi:hypothetical protein